MPQKFPKAPLPLISAVFAPLAWQFGRPDLFDAYSAGVIFMQLSSAALGTLAQLAAVSHADTECGLPSQSPSCALPLQHAPSTSSSTRQTTTWSCGGANHPQHLAAEQASAARLSHFWCRRRKRSNYDFTLLDRNRKAGWALAKKLICRRNSVNRGRLSTSDALRHRYFWPEL